MMCVHKCIQVPCRYRYLVQSFHQLCVFFCSFLHFVHCITVKIVYLLVHRSNNVNYHVYYMCVYIYSIWIYFHSNDSTKQSIRSIKIICTAIKFKSSKSSNAINHKNLQSIVVQEMNIFLRLPINVTWYSSRFLLLILENMPIKIESYSSIYLSVCFLNPSIIEPGVVHRENVHNIEKFFIMFFLETTSKF